MLISRLPKTTLVAVLCGAVSVNGGEPSTRKTAVTTTTSTEFQSTRQFVERHVVGNLTLEHAVNLALRQNPQVLRAIEETDAALTDYREDQARLDRLMEQSVQSSRAADLARVRYREGLSDFLTLLDAERTQLAAEDAVAGAEATVFTGAVRVYQALGGAEIN